MAHGGLTILFVSFVLFYLMDLQIMDSAGLASPPARGDDNNNCIFITLEYDSSGI